MLKRLTPLDIVAAILVLAVMTFPPARQPADSANSQVGHRVSFLR